MKILSERTALRVGAVIVAITLAIGGASPASASTPTNGDAVLQQSLETSPARPLTREEVVRLADGLKTGSASRSITPTTGGSRIAYHLSIGDIVFTYDAAGRPLLPSDTDGQDAGSSPSQVSAGADPFPYVDLDPSEQAAGAGAAAGTVAAAVCAAIGPESAGVGCAVAGGIGLTIVSVLAAHGVCSDDQTFRIYLLTLADQCRE